MQRIKRNLIAIVLAMGLLSSCSSSEKHFLKDAKYRAEVHEQFLKRKELAQARNAELFAVLDQEGVTLEEKEALEFLYAYMPLSDLADYDGQYFLNQVRGAFKTREQFDWGPKIPDELFRHFVLVYRVNTENLDEARDVFFDELKDRVKEMSMEEAVLEVNHWCHEKITYRATDRRTSGPLDLMKTSWGRCGEQSTFTVMALRSVGIPARQCYTPRWVHSDNNHAWVEAWVDGQWRYIGASEPEPELDVAWFTGPAKRAMMVHTNVFGKYNGPEDKTSEKELYSIINVLDTYADTRRFTVQVVDSATQQPVEGAKVIFQVYNYAEFSPIASIETDNDGMVSLKTNREGDIFVWVSKDNEFAYKKVEASELSNVLVLGTQLPTVGEEVFTMHVPSEKKVKELSQEKISANAVRLAYEDSIRNDYMATFISEDIARKLAKDKGLDADKVWSILSLSQGNWQDVATFITDNKDNELLIDYLQSLRDKDLRDTPREYLQHHLENGAKVGIKQGTPNSMYAQYIYSPRIAFELIRPWRTYLQEQFTAEQIKDFQDNPSKLVDYVKDNIIITDTENYYNCPVSPRGVFELKLADPYSRNVFFVAMARSMGIASRVNVATARPEYYDGQWKEVLFEALAEELPKGQVRFIDDKSNLVRPTYSNHYTIGRFDKNAYTTLNYRDDETLKTLPGSISVDEGDYRMVIGSRANDGSVTVTVRYFDVDKGETIQEQVSLPQPEGLIQVLGTIDPNTIIELDSGLKTTVKEQMFEKGVVLVFADPDKEPTKHILQEMPEVTKELDQWGGGIVFIVPDDKVSSAFDASAFKGLPKNTTWATDKNRVILNTAVEALQLDFTNNFPLVLYLNTNGGIIYSNVGYTIGIGEKIIKTIKQEKLTK